MCCAAKVLCVVDIHDNVRHDARTTDCTSRDMRIVLVGVHACKAVVDRIGLSHQGSAAVQGLCHQQWFASYCDYVQRSGSDII
jgi:hypothetical protein